MEVKEEGQVLEPGAFSQCGGGNCDARKQLHCVLRLLSEPLCHSIILRQIDNSLTFSLFS